MRYIIIFSPESQRLESLSSVLIELPKEFQALESQVMDKASENIEAEVERVPYHKYKQRGDNSDHCADGPLRAFQRHCSEIVEDLAYNASCKHLGTENNLRILTNIYDYLKERVDLLFNSEVVEIKKDDELVAVLKNGDEYSGDYMVAAPGRSGAEWFADQCRGMGLKLTNNQVDIGVRVELPAIIFQHITDVVYESKLVYRTKQYGDRVRTFCMNPYGYVVAENVDGIQTVNGHSYSDEKLRSENTNFALLVSSRFTEPFNEPYRYGKHIASLSNMLGGGVLVQRYGDLMRGTRTTEHRLAKSTVKPTLTAATPGDLSLALPNRQLDDIIEMIQALDKIAPGTANYDTLLYGAEVKFYSSRIQLNENLETAVDNFFAIGDGAGITRGLAQAGASGVKVARVIADRINK